MSGVELISEEREEQLDKHKFDSEKDDLYEDNVLKNAAIYLLTGNPLYYPEDWSEEWRDKFDGKDKIGKLKVAGALIAAEIDKEQRK